MCLKAMHLKHQILTECFYKLGVDEERVYTVLSLISASGACKIEMKNINFSLFLSRQNFISMRL